MMYCRVECNTRSEHKAPRSTWAGVLQGEVLVLELVAVDGLATGSVPGSEVSTLNNIHL